MSNRTNPGSLLTLEDPQPEPLTRAQRTRAAAVAEFGDWEAFQADQHGPEPGLPQVEAEPGEPLQVRIEIDRLPSGFYALKISGNRKGGTWLAEPLFQTSRRSLVSALFGGAKWAAFWAGSEQAKN